MRKHDSAREKTSRNGSGGKVRVTLLIPYEVDKNIEAYSLMEGILKTDVVTKALQEFLHGKGLRSDKAPKITLSY